MHGGSLRRRTRCTAPPRRAARARGGPARGGRCRSGAACRRTRARGVALLRAEEVEGGERLDLALGALLRLGAPAQRRVAAEPAPAPRPSRARAAPRSGSRRATRAPCPRAAPRSTSPSRAPSAAGRRAAAALHVQRPLELGALVVRPRHLLDLRRRQRRRRIAVAAAGGGVGVAAVGGGRRRPVDELAHVGRVEARVRRLVEAVDARAPDALHLDPGRGAGSRRSVCVIWSSGAMLDARSWSRLSSWPKHPLSSGPCRRCSASSSSAWCAGSSSAT